MWNNNVVYTKVIRVLSSNSRAQRAAGHAGNQDNMMAICIPISDKIAILDHDLVDKRQNQAPLT